MTIEIGDKVVIRLPCSLTNWKEKRESMCIYWHVKKKKTRKRSLKHRPAEDTELTEAESSKW